MIERLLVIKLDVAECEAEAWLNGVPVARAGADDPSVRVAVNEFTLAGDNHLMLRVWPPAPGAPETPPAEVVASGRAGARLRLLLPRVGQPADEASARTLGEQAWAPLEGTRHPAPQDLACSLSLPVGFPRWRWQDAPVIPPGAVAPEAACSHLQSLAEALEAGNPEPYLAATRWRVEELAAAYQRDARDDLRRLREQWLALHEAGTLRWMPMKPADLVLRRVAGGRLLECLDISGAPFLRTLPDDQGRALALPMRMAWVEGKFYGLR
jgi:hypothetical protein